MHLPRISTSRTSAAALASAAVLSSLLAGCAGQPRKWGASPTKTAKPPKVETTNASVQSAAPSIPTACETGACVAVCDRTGEPDACKEAGYALRDGSGVETNFAKAALAFDKACKRNQRYACHELAKAYSVGEGVQADAAKAVGLYANACDMGVGQACDDLAKLHDKGELVAQDHAKAVELLGRGCAAEDFQVWTCTSVRKLVDKKDKAAVKLAADWKKACAAKDATACKNLERLSPKDAAKSPKK